MDCEHAHIVLNAWRRVGGSGGRSAGPTQGGAYTRRCTQKAVHTRGGPVATAGFLVLKGGAGAGPCKTSRPLSVASRSKGFGCARRGIHKGVHTQGNAHARRPVATVVFLLLKGGAGVGPSSEQSEPSV